ncbi:MAG TPA: hypothetical protein VM513_17740 [Kofleriaceae bacterium]|nr:hypothetical protein [Kofleriaceae bacterium]
MNRFAAVVFALALALPAAAGAWEPETTQAGLAEQAALSSRLHQRLVSIGFTGGLFEPLTIPPADAPALTNALKLLSPSHGAVPDARGRQVALAWIAAGAALADIPAAHGANHFFDPQTKGGWKAPSRGLLTGLSDKVREAVGRAALPAQGIPAPDWVTHKANPFNLDNFYAQYVKAVSAKTPGERSRHMAAALVAAGAILHTLGDLGAPSRVRGDEAAHLEPLGAGPDDLGSRFERIAALAFGRLGVPGPSRVITREHLRDYFIAPAPTANKLDGGLVDVVARSYFSPNTLPAPTRVGTDTKPRLARNEPALPARLNLMAASRDDGTTLRNPAGTCLARYKVERGTLSFWMDDECMLDQIEDLLPEVAAYEAGLLDFLLRGDLSIKIADTITVSGKGLGPGTIEILVEDDRGVRTSLVSAQTGNGEELAKVAAPANGTRIVAVYRGVDAAGEPIVAVGAMPFSR